MRNYEMPFSRPFSVRMPSGLERIFLNAYDALDFLENEWPIRIGPCYSAAVLACQATLKGYGSCRRAREALLDACLEAGLEPIATEPPMPGSSTIDIRAGI